MTYPIQRNENSPTDSSNYPAFAKAVKKLTLLTFGGLFMLTSYSQSLKQNVADRYYATLTYEKAAPMYAELAKKRKANTEVIRRAADSYRLLSMPIDAEKWYSKLVTKTDVKAMDYYNYAQILLMNKKYSDADTQMQKFYELKTDNSVARRYANSTKTYPSDFKKDSAKFIIKNMEGINSTESDFAPSYFSKTELTYATAKETHGANNKQFAWDNTSFLDIYIARLDSSKQTIEKNSRFEKAFETSYHDGPVSFSPDGKMLLLTRSNYYHDKLEKSSSNIVNVQLYYAKKEGDTWGALKPFPFNNKDYSFGQACFAPDGKTIYFVSDMPGTYGYTDIWQTTYHDSSFTEPKNLGQEINTEGREMFPFIDRENLLLFSSDGHLGLGGLDIHIATLAGNPTYIGNMGYPANTNKDDFGLIYDTQTLKGYFSSNRDGGKGKDDLYAIKFKGPVLGVKVFNGYVTDELNKEPVPFAFIQILDEKGTVINELKADAKGKFSAIIPRNQCVTIKISKDSYNSHIMEEINFADVGINEWEIVLGRQVFFVDGLLLDSVTNKPINRAKVSISYTIITKDSPSKLTNTKGHFRMSMNAKPDEEKVRYLMRIEKAGYQSKEMIIERSRSELALNPVIKVIEKLQPLTTPDMAGAGDDFMAIEPIFFDLDESVIRPDAKIQLDELVELLKTEQSIKLKITASADCRANYIYNMNLSQRRAISVESYLVNKGISKNRLKLSWTGESALTTNCPCEPGNESPCTEDQHQQNRRASFKVTNYKLGKTDVKPAK